MMNPFRTASLPFSHRLALATPLLLLLHGALQAETVTLYDDSLGNKPGEQSWLLFGADGIVTEAADAQGVNFSTGEAVKGGYSNHVPFFNILKNPTFPALDRSAGFQLTFELQAHSEGHSSHDRAGFSVILLAGDKKGIELGFWTDTIFAQSEPPFTHAEEVSFDTATAEVQYDLLVLGDLYKLSANGAEILSGSVRDYSAFGVPYALPNYLFLGDDTTSAGASVTLGDVTLATGVPEPAEWALMAFGIGGIGIMALRRRICGSSSSSSSELPG